MKHLGRILTALILAGAIYFILPGILFPSGVWHRHVVRENPLKAPTQITSIRGDTLYADGQELRLAGVTLPTDATLARRATELLRVSTAQGVEIVRPVQPEGTFILRCEPRVWHWCGNDSVRAHYEQFNLNELLVAFGYATFDPKATGLTEIERRRIKAAETIAKEHHRGIWSESRNSTEGTFDPEFGLNISYAHNLNPDIDFMAEDMTEPR